MIRDKISIAIDGPASSGKSTIAKEIANRLNINYIDTGAMYRGLTYKILENNVDIKNEFEMNNLLNSTKISFKDNEIYLDGININKEIRKNIISKKVSTVASLKNVRNYMLKLQREIASNKSIVMDGRDIGTVVLPNADFKFFITASLEERAKRRFNDLEKEDASVSLDQLKKEIEERDCKDSNRKIAPLKKAEDAILIDNTNLTKSESILKILNIIESNSYVL